MKRIIEFIRRSRRARLERRQLFRATGELPASGFFRVVYKLKAKNHERLARNRLRKQLLSSLAANDTAVLQSLVFLLETLRQDQRTRSEADEAMAKRLATLGDRVELGMRLLDARLQLMEGRLLGAARGGDGAGPAVVPARPGSPGGVNGDLKDVHAPAARVASASRGAERVEPGDGERVALGDGSPRDGSSRRE